MKTLLLLFFCFLASVIFAQNTPNDGIYERTLHKDKPVLDYDFIHEQDVTWEKRIWRVIDIRQKQNETFRYEKEPLISILLDIICEQKVAVYSDEEFAIKLTNQDACNFGTTIDTLICCFNCVDDSVIQIIINEFNPANIKKFRLKEAWFFNEETSSMNVQILGIAPIFTHYDDSSNFLNEGTMFWLYYPHIRALLAKHEAFNPANDGQRLSWEDVFEARLFGSYVVKESNNENRRIQDYKNGEDALLEGENVNSKIRNIEGDLFQY